MTQAIFKDGKDKGFEMLPAKVFTYFSPAILAIIH
jgi:hypothetical protein